MNSVTIFWFQLVSSVFVVSLVTAWYVWPALTKLSRNSALIALLFVHVFRYVGMTELVTGMIDPKLPGEFVSSAAYGDLLVSVRQDFESIELVRVWGLKSLTLL
jgi:hypothetical protein